MKTEKLQSEQNCSPNVWDSFVAHLESVYFEGAAELLNTELISFEYNEYVNSIAI